MGGLTQAAIDVIAERERQIECEGWTPEHDDAHSDGSIAAAAASYAYVSTLTGERRGSVSRPNSHVNNRVLRELWKWSSTWWKPKNPRADLVRAGALILAEIERLDRKNAAPSFPPETTDRNGNAAP